MNIIYGSTLAAAYKEEMRKKVEKWKVEGRRIPHLTVILVGDDPASQSYVRGKAKACEQIGIENDTVVLPKETDQQTLLDTIQRYNDDPEVDGILVQLPLPKHLDERAAIDAISPLKDVDGLHPYNAGCLLTGKKGMVSCTPKGVMAMLESIGLNDLSGKRAVVCGRSNLVGKPLALLLQNKNATVTVVHSKTPDIRSITSSADILIVAMGQQELVKADWVKPGAVVIDVGIHRKEDGKLTGDVDFEDVSKVVSAISPVPKGVGPMTVCMLLENTLEAYQEHEGGKG